jgi:hypothetical protein
MEEPADFDHLMRNAGDIFPNGRIVITYTDDEIIHIDVDDHRFTFEIGSDDDAYIFSDGSISFSIPIFCDGTWE